jgi:glucokinase
MNMRYAIGIDIGATHVKGVVVSIDGEILAGDHFDTGDTECAWRERVTRYVAGIEKARGPADHIGIAAPGLVARDGRSIAWMQGRLAKIQGFDWTAHLGRSSIVPVLNDAHAALLGELWLGAAKGCKNAVLLTLGTGVGGAIVCDGRLLRGHLDRAGHLGHLSLNPDGRQDIVRTPGSLEDAIGDHTVAARTAGRFASTAALVAAYRSGDAEAKIEWLRSVKCLAAALVSIINALDPERIILGGGIAQAGDALFEPLTEFLNAFEWRPTGEPVRVLPAVLGERAGALGVARHAMTFDTEGAE